MREISRALFGSAFVLEALVVMAKSDRFYGSQLAELTGCEGSFATGLLRKLAGVGLIEEVPREPGQARKYYRVSSSRIEIIVDALAGDLLPVAADATVKRIA